MPAVMQKQPKITELGEQKAARVERFFESRLHLVDDRWAGKPFKLEKYQRDGIIRPIFGALDRRGQRRYTEGIIGLPRKHAKSTTIAGISLYCLFGEPVEGQEIYSVASDKTQAGIVFNIGKRMVLRDPMLRAMTRGGIYKDAIEIPEIGAVWRVLPYSESAAQGWHPRVAIIDEYHVHRSSAMRDAMLSGMGGRLEPLLLTVTTAGRERRGPLWDLLETAPRDPRAYLYWLGATDKEDGHDPEVWKRCNPASWVTMPYLKDEYRKLRFSEFERYHLNRFPTLGEERAFDPIRWAACAGKPDIRADRPTVIAVDASLRRDSTAVVMDQIDERGVHHVMAWTFQAEEGRALGYVDHGAVEELLRELWRTFNVTRIACDPHYFVRSMGELYREGLPIEEFPQRNERMVPAAMGLYDVILEGRLRHGGDRTLIDHVLNSGVKETGYGWRLDKVRRDLKIDAAVALAIAVYLGDEPVESSLGFGAVVV